jgi:hypothetical protein
MNTRTPNEKCVGSRGLFNAGCPSPGQTEYGSVISGEAKNSGAMDVLECKGNEASLTATAAR